MGFKRQKPKTAEQLRGAPRTHDETAPIEKTDVLRLALPTMDEDPAAFEIFLTTRQLCERWHMTMTTLKNLIDEGYLPFWMRSPNNKLIFPLSEVIRHERKRMADADVEIAERRKRANSKRNQNRKKARSVKIAKRRDLSGNHSHKALDCDPWRR